MASSRSRLSVALCADAFSCVRVGRRFSHEKFCGALYFVPPFPDFPTMSSGFGLTGSAGRCVVGSAMPSSGHARRTTTPWRRRGRAVVSVRCRRRRRSSFVSHTRGRLSSTLPHSHQVLPHVERLHRGAWVCEGLCVSGWRGCLFFPRLRSSAHARPFNLDRSLSHSPLSSLRAHTHTTVRPRDGRPAQVQGEAGRLPGVPAPPERVYAAERDLPGDAAPGGGRGGRGQGRRSGGAALTVMCMSRSCAWCLCVRRDGEWRWGW